MIDLMVAGRLCGKPTVRAAFNGKPLFSTFKVEAVDKNGQRLFFGCITYSKTVLQAVQHLSEGDSIAMTGEIDLANWRGCDGTKQRWLDMTVCSVLTGHHLGLDLVKGGEPS